MKHLSILLLGMFCFICNSIFAEDIPNNEIWYEANNKLEHTTDCYFPGLYTSAFDIPIISHTFTDGKGVIKFNEDVKKIGFAAFASCDELTSIYVPNSVEIIDEQAFYMCHILSKITFSTSLHTIGDDAFNGCDFNSISIPNTVTDIGSRAFAQCYRLTNVQIPESVTKIGDGAFSSNEGLSTIIVDSNNPIYDSRENCNAIIETATNTIIAAAANTVIPESVTAIGNEAYERRAELTSFTIPENITVIGDRAFSECWNLEEVNIPNSVTSLGEGAFFFCESLKDIEIPNSVKGTIDEMFCYCRNLQSVTLSSGISYICGRAFTDCKNLTDLYCNAIVPPTIEDDWAFRNVPSNMTIHVPAVSIDMYENAPYWKNFEIVPDIYDKHQQIIVLEDWEVLKRFHDASVLQGEWTRNAWSMENGRGETADESLERLPGVSLVDGHVRSIDLSQSGLTGDVLSLADLSELEYLDLSGNAIANVELPLVSETAIANLRNQTLTDKKDIVWDSPTEQSLTENLPNIMRLATDARSLAEQYTWTLWNAPTATGWRMSLVMKDAMPELRQLSSRIYDNTNGGSTTLQVDAGIAAGSTLPVQFHYLEGDANLSGTVDVLDVQTVVNESFGIGSGWLNKQAADLQADGSINVLDLVHVVNVLLSQEMPSETAANRHMANSSAAQMDNVLLHCQDGQLLMESTERVSALDLWLRLPQRSTENEVKNLLMGFDMATRQSGNLCHVVLYSPMGMEMEGMGEALLSLPQGSTLLRASAADAEACHMTVALSHQTTHITEEYIDTLAEPVYDLQGRISTARGLHISKQHGRYTKSLTK